jgi:hypothetical protein
MIVLTKGETQDIYFTATENCLLTNPYFLLNFTNRVTQEVVTFVETNRSLTARYDSVRFDVNLYFEDAETGFWTYEIFETDDDTVTSSTGLNKVEDGYMYLNPEIPFEPIKYDEQSNSFITYNG